MYGSLFRLPRVPLQAVLGFLAQLTQLVAPIGTVLVVQAATGSLALAGLAAAAFSLGAGLARPLQGRLMDRHGSRPILDATAAIHVCALLGLVAGAAAGFPGWSLVALAALAGAGLPPVSVSMRVEWGQRIPAASRTAAYSLVYLVQELALLTGPLLFTLVIALLASPSLALAGVALAAGLSTVLFARALHAGSPPPASAGGGLFTRPGVPLLLVVAVLAGCCLGVLEVGAPALAAARGTPALTGLLIAGLSLGGITGAIVYGMRPWHAGPGIRLIALLAPLGLCLAPLAWLTASALDRSAPVLPLAGFGVAMFLAGLTFNPSLTTVSLLVDELAPGARSEAFGWLSTAIGLGTASGSGLAGLIGDRFGPAATFAAASAAALLAAFLATLLHLTRTRHRP